MLKRKPIYGELPDLSCSIDTFMHGRVLCVIDMDWGKSVTNDVEAVVQHCIVSWPDWDRLIYKDSTGTWDEIVVTNGRFDQFRRINEEDLEKALQKLLSYY